MTLNTQMSIEDAYCLMNVGPSHGRLAPWLRSVHVLLVDYMSQIDSKLLLSNEGVFQMCPSSIHSEQGCLSELSTPLTDIHGMLGQVRRMQHSAALHTCARDVEPAPEAARPVIAHASEQPMPQGRDVGSGLADFSMGAAAASGGACVAARAEAGDAAGAGFEGRAEGSPNPDPGEGCAVQHTFRVTVEAASGLSAGSAGAEARFIRYLFPGACGCTEAVALCGRLQYCSP